MTTVLLELGARDVPGARARAGGGGRRRRAGGLAALVLLVGVVALASIALGSRDIPLRDVVDALVAFDGSRHDLIVRELRLPRTVLGLAVGASLGVGGALMQGLTRNPLADPGILGVNGGAALAVVIAIHAFGIDDLGTYVWFAVTGAAIAGIVVYGLGTRGRGGTSPVKLALAGAAVSAFLGSVTTSVLLSDEATLDQYRFWGVGSLAGRGLDVAAQAAPFLVVGGVLAAACVRRLDALALGDDAARSLGHRVGITRLLLATGTFLLVGGSVAAAGPIAFVGLAVPHAARAVAGAAHAWLLPYAAAMGAVLVLTADTAGRLIARPAEVQVGIVTALIGAPYLVALVRRRRVGAA